MRKRVFAFTFLMLLVFGAAKSPAQSTSQDLILATAPSMVDTFLLDTLLPIFEKNTGYMVRTISIGTGQALAMGERGEVDVILAHAPEAERKLVDSAMVINYRLVMHNDFVIVGPPEDPAGIKGKASAEALKTIAGKQALFISRGDGSGTYKKELSVWKNAEVVPAGKWYQQSGQGMSATLIMTSYKGAYTLTDRGTYLARGKNLKLEILSEGDQGLLNIYHVMAVNPDKFKRVNGPGAKAFVEFMVAPETQKLIAEFGKDKYGQPLFFSDAVKQMMHWKSKIGRLPASLHAGEGNNSTRHASFFELDGLLAPWDQNDSD